MSKERVEFFNSVNKLVPRITNNKILIYFTIDSNGNVCSYDLDINKGYYKINAVKHCIIINKPINILSWGCDPEFLMFRGSKLVTVNDRLFLDGSRLNYLHELRIRPSNSIDGLLNNIALLFNVYQYNNKGNLGFKYTNNTYSVGGHIHILIDIDDDNTFRYEIKDTIIVISDLLRVFNMPGFRNSEYFSTTYRYNTIGGYYLVEIRSPSNIIFFNPILTRNVLMFIREFLLCNYNSALKYYLIAVKYFYNRYFKKYSKGNKVLVDNKAWNNYLVEVKNNTIYSDRVLRKITKKYKFTRIVTSDSIRTEVYEVIVRNPLFRIISAIIRGSNEIILHIPSKGIPANIY